jgi:hypothetical protein
MFESRGWVLGGCRGEGFRVAIFLFGIADGLLAIADFLSWGISCENFCGGTCDRIFGEIRTQKRRETL